MLKILVMILTCIFVVVYREGDLYPNMPAFELNPAFEPIPALETIPAPTPISAPEQIPGLEPIPESETIPAPESLPVSEKNGALQPTEYSEKFLIGTAATIKKTEYALSWAFQRIRLSEHKDNFWMILDPLVLSLVTILSCLMVYRHSIRVSYRQDETTQGQSQLSMLLHQREGAMMERMQELRKLHAQFQNERDSLKMIAKARDEILIYLLSDSMRKMEVEDDHDAHSHNELDSVRTEEEDEECPAHFQNEEHSVMTMQPEAGRPSHFQNEGDSVRTVEEEDERSAHHQNEAHSVRNWKMRAEERRLKFQKILDLMPIKMKEDEGEGEEEDEDKDDGHYQDEVGLVIKTQEEGEQPAHFQIEKESVREISVRTVAEEDGRPSQFQNGVDSLKNLAMRAEERRLTLAQIMDIMPTIVEEDEDEDNAQSIMDSVRTVEEEDECTSHSHNEEGSVMRMKMEDERAPHFQNEVDSVTINKPRLPLTLMEEIVGHQVSMDSPVKMGRRWENCIEASRFTGEKEKKDPMNKMGVCLAPPPNLKARGAKVVSQSSPCHRPSGMDVKIYNKKVDYSKVKAKVDTWRKIQIQGEGDSKGSDKIS
jgi:hypothetical protein